MADDIDEYTRRLKGFNEDLKKKVEQAKVPLQVVLGTTDVTVGDIIRLGVGDVVPLGTMADQELHVMVGDKMKFRGRPGTVRNKMAVQLTDVVDERELEDE